MKSKPEATYEEAPVGQFGHRFCSTCYAHVKSDGGMWKVSPKKTNRRWICARCLEKRVKGAPVK